MRSGHSPYRSLSAATFDRLCQRTGLTGTDLAGSLREEFKRPDGFTRQTVASWRAGLTAVPLEVFFAVARKAGFRIRSIENLLAPDGTTPVMEDPDEVWATLLDMYA